MPDTPLPMIPMGALASEARASAAASCAGLIASCRAVLVGVATPRLDARASSSNSLSSSRHMSTSPPLGESCA